MRRASPKDFIITMPADMRLASIEVKGDEVEALLAGAQFAMGASAPPQILITLAARFGRVSWKYKLDRLCAHSEGCRGDVSDILPNGDRDGTGRMRNRDRQYRSVRENYGDRTPRRRPGRSVCDRSRRRSGPTAPAARKG